MKNLNKEQKKILLDATVKAQLIIDNGQVDTFYNPFGTPVKFSLIKDSETLKSAIASIIVYIEHIHFNQIECMTWPKNSKKWKDLGNAEDLYNAIRNSIFELNNEDAKVYCRLMD